MTRLRVGVGLLLAAAVLALRLALGVSLSAEPAAPSLTELQRLRLQTMMQRLELAQLRAQAIQREFDDAKRDLVAFAETLKQPGYELDLGALAYRRVPAPAEGP